MTDWTYSSRNILQGNSIGHPFNVGCCLLSVGDWSTVRRALTYNSSRILLVNSAWTLLAWMAAFSPARRTVAQVPASRPGRSALQSPVGSPLRPRFPWAHCDFPYKPEQETLLNKSTLSWPLEIDSLMKGWTWDTRSWQPTLYCCYLYLVFLRHFYLL